MKSTMDCYQLHNGVLIPCIGLGTYDIPNTDAGAEHIKDAIETGYRLVDTAAGYGNEEAVGKAVEKANVAREDVFVVSKLPNEMHEYDNAMKSFEQSMERLNLSYLDLFLIHWPNPIQHRSRWKETVVSTWRAFEELLESGRVRAIGVSNFLPHHMDVLEHARFVPMINQIRLCPGDTDEKTITYCRLHNIQLMAYSPLGSGQIFEVESMKQLRDKYRKTISQICLRWQLQMGFLPVPRTNNPARLSENIDVFDFELADEDMKTITGLTGCCGYAPNPDDVSF